MRQAFVTALSDIARKDKRIFLLTGDLGFRFLEKFRDRFPDRFLNIGVAEANLVTVAAGLSTTGYVPFIYSIATFASMRPFEQIRNDIALQNLNVKIVAIGAGLAYTKAGPTHHSMEDIALMRTLPNMTIVAPADPQETYAAVREIAAHKGPVYLRLERNPDQSVYDKPPQFRIGKGYRHRKGSTVALCVTGTKVGLANDVTARLNAKGIHPSVYSFPTIAPLDTVLLRNIARAHRIIATIEEHRVSGGFGTVVLEALHGQRPVVRFGLIDEYTPVSAAYDVLCAYHGFTARRIASTLLKMLKGRKRGR